MARPPRHFDRDQLYFVTTRTFQERCFLRPDPNVTETVGAVLARAQRMHGVKIFGLVVMSNHIHLIIQGEAACIAAFARDAFGNIARRVGCKRKWDGKFWASRYSAAPILDDGASIDRLRYIFAHGVKEGLVDSGAEWPGLHFVNVAERNFVWRDCRGREHHEVLRISPLPCWQKLTGLAHARTLTDVARQADYESRKAREGKPSLGVAGVMKMNPLARPKSSKRSARPWCHGSTSETVRSFRERFHAFVAAYRKCSSRARAGRRVMFPEGSFPPPTTKS